MKVKIKCELKSNESNYTYDGYGILQNNEIIFKDNKIMTKIKLLEPITLTRKEKYELKIVLNPNKITKCTYIIPEGVINLSIKTAFLKKTNNSLKATYILMLNNKQIDKFYLKFNYTIDTI